MNSCGRAAAAYNGSRRSRSAARIERTDPLRLRQHAGGRAGLPESCCSLALWTEEGSHPARVGVCKLHAVCAGRRQLAAAGRRRRALQRRRVLRLLVMQLLRSRRGRRLLLLLLLRLVQGHVRPMAIRDPVHDVVRRSEAIAESQAPQRCSRSSGSLAMTTNKMLCSPGCPQRVRDCCLKQPCNNQSPRRTGAQLHSYGACLWL